MLKLPIDKKLAVWYNGNSARVRCARAAEKNSAAFFIVYFIQDDGGDKKANQHAEFHAHAEK